MAADEDLYVGSIRGEGFTSGYCSIGCIQIRGAGFEGRLATVATAFRACAFDMLKHMQYKIRACHDRFFDLAKVSWTL